jgi:Rieske 2Fe-2S family protein
VLCDEGAGHAKGAFVCPYHNWSYELEGRLVGTPNVRAGDDFDRSSYPLRRVACEQWEGFVFVHLGADPRPLLEQLAEEPDAPLDYDRYGVGELRVGHRIEYEVAANWKLVFQNFSECLHCPPVHPKLARLSDYKSGANDLRDGPVLGGYMLLTGTDGSLTTSGRMCGLPLGDLTAEERRRVYYYSIFPSFFLTVQPDFVMSTRLSPIAVDRSRIVCEWHFAPETLSQPGLDPSEGVALWDETNRQDWHICELSQRGVSSRAYVPGLYSKQESLLAAFDREYLATMQAGD